MSERELFLKAVKSYRPIRAVVMGSGIASAFTHYPILAETPWNEWPGAIPMPHVVGHAGLLRIVKPPIGPPVLLIGGRLHRYEGHATAVTTRLIQQLPELGCRELILTCATGGIDERMAPGSVALVVGWIDMARPVQDETCSSLRDMQVVEHVPDSPLRQKVLKQALVNHEILNQGIAAQMMGPCYETRAEIRMIRSWGAAMVGMSSGHEWKAAIGVGLDVQVLSLITNWACGIVPGKIDHAGVVRESGIHAVRLATIVMGQEFGK